MRRQTGKRSARYICIAAIAPLMWGGCFLRAGLSDSGRIAPTERPGAPPSIVIISIATPEPADGGQPPAAAESPAAAQAQTASPRPKPTPAATPAPTLEPDLTEQARGARLEEAAGALGSWRSPNRMKRAEIDAVLETLPPALDLSRTMIVLKAYSLLGKIPYQWGGKSRALGWDMEWGRYAAEIVSGQNCEDSVPSGMDCSGFVRWCFINASGTVHTGKRFGSGTYKQWLNSTEITMAEALPGDLVFTNQVGRTNHNGIVVQNNGHGKLMVIHCVRDRGVVLESAADGKFIIARRPNVLRGKNLDTFEASALRHKGEPFMADLRYLLALRSAYKGTHA